MTTSRDIVERLDGQRKMLGAQVDALNEQISSIREEHKIAIREMLYEEKILSQVVWVIKAFSCGKSVELIPHKDSEEKAEEIASMMDNDGWYHFSFELKEPGFTFRFDDFEIRIIMDPETTTHNSLRAFIQSNELQVDVGEIDKVIEHHENKAKVFQAIKAIVQ